MEKRQVVDLIRAIANEKNGDAPGWQAFKSATGIRKSDWYPHLWLRWGDALQEAGFQAKELQSRLDDSLVIEKYINFARQLGHLPVEGELRRNARSDKSFPSHTVFRRFGGKQRLIDKLWEYCRGKQGYEDILGLCERQRSQPSPVAPPSRGKPSPDTGYVYLMKSGRHYKIGRTNSVGRRGRELAIQIPVPPRTVHSIETDDPAGVEAYWHRRFAEKRGEGEWFELSSEDVDAFKRWKRIV